MIDTNLNSSYPFVGGENNGLNSLKNYLWKSKNIEKYKETRNGLIGTEYSSKFSAYLCLGCISPVMIYQEVKRYEKEIKKIHLLTGLSLNFYGESFLGMYI